MFGSDFLKIVFSFLCFHNKKNLKTKCILSVIKPFKKFVTNQILNMFFIFIVFKNKKGYTNTQYFSRMIGL